MLQDDLEGSAVDGCGVDTAHALARCVFGDSLVDAFTSLPPADFHNFLQTWRDNLRKELYSNSQGFLKSRRTTLSTKISDAFPNLEVLKAYVSPVTSETVSNAARLPPPPDRWRREHSLARLASFCERKFEWGTKVQIPKRFASLLWGGALIRIIRRAALDLDEGIAEPGKRVISSEASMPFPGIASCPSITPKKEKAGRVDPRGGGDIGTPSKIIAKYFTELGLRSPGPPNVDSDDDLDQDGKCLIKEITGSTTSHPSTDHMLEYRVEIDPTQLVALAISGIQGDREEPDGDDAIDDGDESPGLNSKGPDEDKIVKGPRFWVPASMLRMVEPDLVATYETSRASKGSRKKARKKPGVRSKNSDRARSRASVLSDSEESWEDHSPTRTKSKTSLPSHLSPIYSDDDRAQGVTRVTQAHVGRGDDDPFSAVSASVLSGQCLPSTSRQRERDQGARSVITSRSQTGARSAASRHSQAQEIWEELFTSTGTMSKGRRDTTKQLGARQFPAGLDPLSDSSSSHCSDANGRPASPSPLHTMNRTATSSVLAPIRTMVPSTSSTSGLTVGEIIEISSDSDTNVPHHKSPSSSLTQTLAPGTFISRQHGLPRRTTTNSSPRIRAHGPAPRKKFGISSDSAPLDKSLPQPTMTGVHHPIIDLSSP